MGFMGELWQFLKVRKKFWMLPIIIVMVLLGGLLVLAQGSVIAPFIYTISCMHCMSVSLANHGMGLGAAWGREKAVEMLNEAEFTDVRVEQLEHDIMNYYYVMHKHA